MTQSDPFIRFFVRFGRIVALTTALVVLLAGGLLAFAGAPHWVTLAAGALSLSLFVLLRLLAEFVAVIADTLLPQ